MPTPLVIPFPQSSQPGDLPGEGVGRLVNRYYEVDGAIDLHRWVPGLAPFADVGIAIPRGQIDVNGTLYVGRNNAAARVSTSGAVTALTGALNGSDLVTWAKNNRSPTPDLVAVSVANGAYSVSSTAVTAYPDANLTGANQPNSVSFLDGYFLFTLPDGRIFASGVNDIWVSDSDHTQNALSFALADLSGGLVRGTSAGGLFYAWGKKACTVYSDAATSPFPLARSGVIQVGLLGASAITGFDPGWGLAQYFVATDNTVRRVDGFAATPVSNLDVVRDIAAEADKTQIEMSCYVIGGRPTVVVKGPNFCWELNAATGFWNERRSANQNTWRASRSIYFNGKWYYGDMLSNQLAEISSSVFDELGAAFTARLESGPVKQFPHRIQCVAAYFDFTTGMGHAGTSDSTDPSLWISTSRDGGATWSTPLVRRGLGQQGDFQRPISVNRIGGIATQHGIRFRLDTSSPIYSTFRGGRCDVNLLGPP
jgi:hypothetical protein